MILTENISDINKLFDYIEKATAFLDSHNIKYETTVLVKEDGSFLFVVRTNRLITI